jgi:hypothetical protein
MRPSSAAFLSIAAMKPSWSSCPSRLPDMSRKSGSASTYLGITPLTMLLQWSK